MTTSIKRIGLFCLPLLILIFSVSPCLAELQQLEYFVDEDPGFGEGISLTLSGVDDQAEIDIDTRALAKGVHTLYVRAQDTDGTWSIIQSGAFTVNFDIPTPPPLVQLEWFIDRDPGFGKGNPETITSDTDLTDSIELDLENLNLEPGIHTLYVRAKNDNNQWSIMQAGSFAIPPPIIPLEPITQIEYFIDKDPGYGKGSIIDVTPPIEEITETINVDLETLRPGIHTLYVRVQDEANNWGILQHRSFFKPESIPPVPPITQLEYFIDQDPGFEKGIDIQLPSDVELTELDQSFPVALEGLSSGVHVLYVRAKHKQNGEERWSVLQHRSFFIPGEIPPPPNIVRAEYFIDHDPGLGAGEPIPFVTGGTNIFSNFVVDLQELPVGFHSLYVRVQDEKGKWSILQSRSLYVTLLSDPTEDIVELEYFVGQDPGFGLGIPILITSEDRTDIMENFVVDITQLSVGKHQLFIRGRNASDRWSILQTKEFDVGSPPENALVIEDVTVTERLNGEVTANFLIRLIETDNRQESVTVEFETTEGSATADSDFVSKSGSYTFESGVSTHTIDVQVKNDLIEESTESFFVRLKNPVNARLTRPQARGTIKDVKERIRNVVKLDDSGPGSLRETIAVAEDGDILTVNLHGSLVLTSEPLVVDKSISIIANSSSRFVIDGDETLRVLSITADDVHLENITITKGHAELGGGIHNQGENLTLSRVTIANNTASQNGAGIYNDGGSISMVNATVSGNRATVNGGGIFNSEEGDLGIFSSTLAENNADGTGGAIHNEGQVTLTHTLLAHGDSGSNCSGSNTPISDDFNLDSDSSCGLDQANDLMGSDPGIDNLADNKGAVDTHNLQLGSPAIDAGNPQGCHDADGKLLRIDQRGFSRIVDGDDEPGLVCDIGAIEASFSEPPEITEISLESGTEVAVSSMVTIRVSVEGSETDIDRVEFFIGESGPREVLAPPFEWEWQMEPGVYNIVIRVVDTRGVVSTSEVIQVVGEDFSIDFLTPRVNESPISVNDSFLFLWNIPDVDQGLEFDLYLDDKPPTTVDDLADAFPLAEGLTGETHKEGYNHLDGFLEVFADAAADSDRQRDLYPVIHVKSEPFKDALFAAEDHLTIIRDKSPRDSRLPRIVIVKPKNFRRIQFGESIDVRAFVVDRFRNVIPGQTDIQLQPNHRVGSDIIEVPCSEDPPRLACPMDETKGILTTQFTPTEGGDWRLDIGPSAATDSNIQSNHVWVKVLPSPSQLTVIDAENTRISTLNEDRQIKGWLSFRRPGFENALLAGNTVRLQLLSPAGSRSGQGDNTGEVVLDILTEGDGYFEETIPGSFFNADGDWQGQVIFSGSTSLRPSVSEPFILPVRKKQGYAVLLLGQTAEGNLAEGLDVHENTINFVNNSLIDSDFKEEDIEMVRWIGGQEKPVKEKLAEAILRCAGKMVSSPAPFYLVMVNHGDPKRFHIYDPDPEHEILSPAELNAMLAELETVVSADEMAKKEPVIAVLGMCFSGSFIDQVSKPGRIIISAATQDERSIREPFLVDGVPQQGEYFVYLLFNELRNGSSLFLSFQRSRRLISTLTENLLFADRNTNDNKLRRGQNPLLDDDGDGIGHTIVSGMRGDGRRARSIFLAQPRTRKPIDIERNNPSRFLGPDDDFLLDSEDNEPFLWAEIPEEAEEVEEATVKMAFRKPGDLHPEIDSSMQLDLELENLELINPEPVAKGIRYQWPDPDTAIDPEDFFPANELGRYEIYFYVEMDASKGVSLPGLSSVYRGDGLPQHAAFGLLQPDDGGLVNFNPDDPESLGLFSWEPSHIELGEVHYLFRLWEQGPRDQFVFESRPIKNQTFYVLPSALINRLAAPKYYWWDVVAVDEMGNAKISDDVYRFRLEKDNALFQVAVAGHVRHDLTGEVITDDSVQVTSNENDVILKHSQGVYLAVIPNVLQSVKIKATADEFLESDAFELNRVANSEPIFHDFRLKKELAHVTLTINSPYGDPVGAGDYETGSVATWWVTNPFIDPNNPRVRFVTDDSEGRVEMIKDTDFSIDWRKEFLMSFKHVDAEGKPLAEQFDIAEIETVGEGWWPQGEKVTWLVPNTVDVIPGSEQLVPDKAGKEITLDQAQDEIIVQWTRQHYMELETNGIGGICLSDENGCVDENDQLQSTWNDRGDRVMLKAVAACDGLVFDHWLVSDSGSSSGNRITSENPLTVVMDQARRIEAKFVPTEFDSRLNLQLDMGWNLVSLPMVLNSESAENLLNQASGQVWTWDKNQFRPATDIAPKVGYWIYSTEKQTLPIIGKLLCDEDYVLEGGWSLTGPPHDMSTRTLNPLLAWSWAEKLFKPVRFLHRMKGYWVFSNTPGGN